MYVSASARATQKAATGLPECTFLLDGSVDALTAELTMLEAVVLAEAKDHGNWELLAQLAGQMLASPVRTQLEAATERVLAQEENHYGWARGARAEMLMALATGGAGGVPDGSELTRDELYTQAQELGIEGRSQMTKDELARAITEQTGAQT
jgi:hypothetical protein